MRSTILHSLELYNFDKIEMIGVCVYGSYASSKL